jgi:hypothetical protein
MKDKMKKFWKDNRYEIIVAVSANAVAFVVAYVISNNAYGEVTKSADVFETDQGVKGIMLHLHNGNNRVLTQRNPK